MPISLERSIGSFVTIQVIVWIVGSCLGSLSDASWAFVEDAHRGMLVSSGAIGGRCSMDSTDNVLAISASPIAAEF